ncbi:MAG: lipopolysaccharide biosynthesis protein [Gammaproteobacteria bacterium]
MSSPDFPDALRNALHRGAAGAFAVSIAGAGLGFAAHVLVARLVGKDDYGTYALMLSWISVLSVLAQAGQDNNVVRFLPTYLLRGDWGKARGLRRGIGSLVLAVSVVVAITGCLVITVFEKHQSLPWRVTFYIGFAMLPLLTQLQQSGAMHRAFKRAASATAYVSIGRPLVLIAVVLAFAAAGLGVDAPLAAAASAASAAVALGLSAWHLSRGWPPGARKVQPKYEMGAWIRMGVKMSVLSFVIAAAARIDVLMLGALMGAQVVGPYYAAVQIAGFAFYAFQAVNVILAPMIAERYDTGDLRGLEAVVRRGARLGFAGGVISAGIFVLIGYRVLGLFGPSFESAYWPLLILLAGYCAVTAIGPGGFVLSMTRYQYQASIFAGVGLLINAVMAIALIPRIGVLGAALGASAQLVVWHWLTLRYVIAKVGINSSVFGRPRADRVAL